MKKSNPQSAFPVLLVAVLIMIFGGGLFASIGRLIITELTSTRISSLYSLSSGVYVTPEPVQDECNWQYGMSHKMHWPQLPDFGITGMDVETTLAVLADDFKCTSSGPINDIHFWASFVNDVLPLNEPNSLSFEISIYADIPATANMWSMPGDVLWTRVFLPGDYTVRQIFNRPSDWYNPLTQTIIKDNHRLAFQYNFCIEEDPFIQEEGTVYWLRIREIRSFNAIHKMGWKTTTKKLRWNDSAVYSMQGSSNSIPINYPKGHIYEGERVNLAFVITDGDQGDGLHDLGDAPDSFNAFPGKTMLAYPDANTAAYYPTTFWTNFPPYGPIHWEPERWFYLGRDVSFESAADNGYDEDINNNLYPPGDFSNRDRADDGLRLPLILPHCELTTIEYTATFHAPITAKVPAYLNIWCDWNRDGDWDDTIICNDGTQVPEWAVENAAFFINSTGTVAMNSPAFMCWHPQTDDEPAPMWLRITISEKPRETSDIALFGSGGSGPADGYTYGETEDYLLFPKTDPNSVEYDWGDTPDSFLYPAYPTISTNDGANHIIAGPWLGDVNDRPDPELNGQPDPNALGDDFDTGPLFSLGPPNDDENGVTVPPLIPGYPADVTLEVGGGGGIVQVWIDYNSDMDWQPDEQVYNNFLSPGMHVISFIVRDDAEPGQSFARFRISRDGGLNPNGPALDGEVEDYEVFIQPISRYTKWLQLPDVTPYGIDIQVDSNDERQRIIADDFECISTEHITDVHFWGSWKDDIIGDILKIRLSFYADDPAGSIGSDPDNPYSQPAPVVLWSKNFYPGQFREKLYHVVRKPGEWWWDLIDDEIIAGGDRQIWQIDIDIDPNEAFMQMGTLNDPRIYWLEIQVDANDGEFGWKTRRWPDHYMDDAVWDSGSELPRMWRELRYPKKHPYHDIERNSIDMAFQLTYSHEITVPTIHPVNATQCPVVQTKCPTEDTQCPPINTQCPVQKTQCVAITVCNGSSETVCPALSTECPVIDTECPASETSCPPVETECPPEETYCPPDPTLCQPTILPEVSTRCPVVDTKCPVIETECPVQDTKCPTEDTRCPVEDTRCPPTESRCVAITICNGSSETQCPAVYTRCPITDTECPVEETRCPPEDTVCPPLDTECPPQETMCPVEETGCPSPPTECMVIETRCPEEPTRCPPEQCQPVETVYPVVDTKCPTEDTRCPTETTRCPAVYTRCPVTQTQCPVHETRCPSQDTSCPPVNTQCPPVETECPVEDTKCPPADTQCPVEDTRCPPTESRCVAITICNGNSDTQCPAVYTRCPITETECPVSETRCPITETGCPVSETKCPLDETWCPVVDTMCPVVETGCPAPATQCPRETSCPIEQTRCPVYDTWCTDVPTECPYNQTQCPPPNPTGSCDPPPVPPWDGGTDYMVYSEQKIKEEAAVSPDIPVMDTCPVIEVRSPTIVDDKKLLVKAI